MAIAVSHNQMDIDSDRYIVTLFGDVSWIKMMKCVNGLV